MILGAWVGYKSGRDRGPLTRFFICWFVPGVILLSCTAFKHQHYAFPLLPPMSILGAVGLLKYIEYQHFQKTKLQRLVAVGLIAACVVVGILFHIGTKNSNAGRIGWPVTIIIGVLGIGGLVTIFMEYE